MAYIVKNGSSLPFESEVSEIEEQCRSFYELIAADGKQMA